jgi:GNAT superfamily N-acetyltransferase
MNQMIRRRSTATKLESKPSFEIHPLTKDRWPDFEKLFGPRGACGGCWCMWWRLNRAEYERRKGDGNKRAMKALVKAGEVPGLLAYVGEEPVAWCAVAPRERYSALARSRILKPVDQAPVWSITCFFVEKDYRNKGMTVKLLRAAIEYVKQQGGKIVEGYPVEPKKDRMPEVFAFTGLASAFKKAGFVECLRRSETRPIMRFYI